MLARLLRPGQGQVGRRWLSAATDERLTAFLRAKAAVPLLKAEPANDVKLQLYSLFKQAETGQGPPTERPPLWDPIGRAKWDSWAAVKSLDKDAAMKRYVDLVTELHGGVLPAATATTATAATAAASPPVSAASPTPGTDTRGLIEQISSPRRPGTTDALKLETIATSLSATGVLTAKLNRPQRGNALNMTMWSDLNSLYEAIRQDSGIRCVILTGNEQTFCTGMDLSVFAEMQRVAMKESCEGRKRESLLNFIEYLQNSISAPEKCHVPVLVAVSGPCIGGAIDLITACDLRFCTTSASFCVKEIDLAIAADIGTLQRLPKLIGEQHARDLCFTARTFYGREAYDLGLVLCPPFETEAEMLKFVTEKANSIASKSPLTMRGVKRSLNFSRDHSVEEGLAQIALQNSALLYSNDLLEVMTGAKTFKGN